MSNMTLFKGQDLSAMSMLQDVDDVLTSTIAGGGGGGRRLSIKGSVFREYVNGKEVRVSEERAINVVLINAAPIARTYYAGTYEDGVTTAPTCWSADTNVPAPDVPEDQRQAARCMDCPMNIKGSGQGDTRACRYSQRVAVVLEGAIEDREVYQLSLPATSVFGDAEGGKLPLQAYGRFLKANGAHVMGIVTQLKFDIKSAVPKLFFSAVRPLTKDEIAICIELRDSPEALEAITFSVAKQDGGAPAPKPAAKKKAKPVPVEEDDDDEEEEEAPAPKPAAKKKAKPVPVEEDDDDEEEEEAPAPTVVKRKKAAPVEEDNDDVGSILDEWDD